MNKPARDRARALARAAFPIAQPCEKCSAPHAERHHDDYRRPLKIRWLCRKDHRAHHRKPARRRITVYLDRHIAQAITARSRGRRGESDVVNQLLRKALGL